MQLNKFVFWLDANLPPKAVLWLSETFGVTAFHVFSMDLLSGDDHEIFEKAQMSNEPVILISKDEDFVNLVLRKKAPPYIIWLTAGNLSNSRLKDILLNNLEEAVKKLLHSEHYFIEIS